MPDSVPLAQLSQLSRSPGHAECRQVTERIGVLSGTHLYFLAACEGKAARWLAHVVAGANRQQWQGAQLRLLSGSWPFDQSRTRQWFIEQSALSIASAERFGLPATEVASLQEELRQDVIAWCRRFAAAFPPAAIRNVSSDVQRAAGRLILERTTQGSPKAWGLATEDPEDERRYRDLLYHHNLDLLFHRLLYWADGQRSLLDIVDRLEFERDELQRDTSISRTSSGFAIAESRSPQLDVAAVLALVDRIVASGYLKVREKCPAA